jgi:hypothetical protein
MKIFTATLVWEVCEPSSYVAWDEETLYRQIVPDILFNWRPQHGEITGDMSPEQIVDQYFENSEDRLFIHDQQIADPGLSTLLHQIYQMKGMFSDEDGAIQTAIDEAEEMLK